MYSLCLCLPSCRSLLSAPVWMCASLYERFYIAGSRQLRRVRSSQHYTLRCLDCLSWSYLCLCVRMTDFRVMFGWKVMSSTNSLLSYADATRKATASLALPHPKFPPSPNQRRVSIGSRFVNLLLQLPSEETRRKNVQP